MIEILDIVLGSFGIGIFIFLTHRIIVDLMRRGTKNIFDKPNRDYHDIDEKYTLLKLMRYFSYFWFLVSLAFLIIHLIPEEFFI